MGSLRTRAGPHPQRADDFRRASATTRVRFAPGGRPGLYDCPEQDMVGNVDVCNRSGFRSGRMLELAGFGAGQVL